jgi:hypothetical protein
MVNSLLRGLQIVNGKGATALQIIKTQIQTEVREPYFDFQLQDKFNHRIERAPKSIDFTLEMIQLVFDELIVA